jgi:hypothetical protein
MIGYFGLKPIKWTQEIRSGYKEGVEGRFLNATCTPRNDQPLMLSNKDDLFNHTIHLSFLQGAPTAANGEPLEIGIGKLSYSEAFVHGWYFLSEETYSHLWDHVTDGRFSDCVIVLGISPVEDHGNEIVWNVGRPLFIETANIIFERPIAPADADEPSKLKGLLWKW